MYIQNEVETLIVAELHTTEVTQYNNHIANAQNVGTLASVLEDVAHKINFQFDFSIGSIDGINQLVRTIEVDSRLFKYPSFQQFLTLSRYCASQAFWITHFH